jgi:hypothetical protein
MPLPSPLQMTQRIKLLEAEISSVDSERKRMEAQLRTTTTMSEKEQRELHSKYAEKVNTLKEQLAGAHPPPCAR